MRGKREREREREKSSESCKNDNWIVIDICIFVS